MSGSESNGTETRGTVTNRGVAPIYYDAYPAILQSGSEVRSTVSLKHRNQANNVGLRFLRKLTRELAIELTFGGPEAARTAIWVFSV